MEIKMGYTSITCRQCGTVTAVENEALESMYEFMCPSCGVRMYDYELARLKAQYYMMLCCMYRKHWGSVKPYESFSYHINVHPHFEA